MSTKPIRGIAAAALALGLCLGGPSLAPAHAELSSAVPALAPATRQLDTSKLPKVDLASKIASFQAKHPASHLDRPALRAINPDDYVCDNNTDVAAWVDREVAKLSQDDLQVLQLTGLDMLPAYDAMLATDTAAYPLTVDAQALTKTFRKLQRFWDINSSDIALMQMGGSIYSNVERMQMIYQELGLSPQDALVIAQFVADYVKTSEGLQQGNNPLLTFNAFAYSTFGQYPQITDRIVMGPGLLQAYHELGYGDVAPQVVLAHEFGHHIQFETGMISPDDASSPEGTRRTELHADASAAYFSSHPKGLSMQFKRVAEFNRVFYGIGDCSFTSDGHHGTSAQRMRAATWGYQLQEANRPKSYIHPVLRFRELFDAALPTLVAPDA
ncbi:MULTISPECIES: hypothetical protein [unclassified Luteococcus]|uniref:hypothetical protein n=1 Tax=unclassified Luteococcus TaxID=2639923 RepID=UPI00313CA7D6